MDDLVDSDPCVECPIARRGFLLAAAGTVAAALGLTAAEAHGLTFRAARAIAIAAAEVTYRISVTDGVESDATNEVMIVRWRNRVYALSSLCPHRQAPLRWASTVGRITCSKHNAQFSADGLHTSGRATRNIDRHPLRRVGTSIVVNTGVLYQSDAAAAQWNAAFIAL